MDSLQDCMVVFSKTLSRVEWNNSVLLHEIDPEEITKMKQEPGRDMVIYGSASIVQNSPILA